MLWYFSEIQAKQKETLKPLNNYIYLIKFDVAKREIDFKENKK